MTARVLRFPVAFCRLCDRQFSWDDRAEHAAVCPVAAAKRAHPSNWTPDSDGAA